MSRLISTCLVLLALLAGAVCVGGAGVAEAAGADERLTVGLKAYQDRFYSLAAKELRAFLEAAPEDPRTKRVLQVLAQAEIGQQNWAAAREVLERFVGAGGDPQEAFHRLVWVASRQGDGPGAAGYAEQFARLPGAGGARLGDVLELAARTAWEGNHHRLAAGLYERFLKAVAGDPRRPRVWASRVAILEEVKAPPEEILQVVDAALREGLPDAKPRASVGQAGIRAARARGESLREAELWTVLAGAAEDPALQRRARLETGLASARAGEGGAAENALTEFLGMYSAGEDVARAHLALEEIARGRGDWGRVRSHLEALLALPVGQRAGRQEAELRRGALTAALEGGDEGAAVPHAEALLDSSEPLAPIELGAIHLLLGRRASARGDPVAAVEHWLLIPSGVAQYRVARLAAAALLVESGAEGRAWPVVQPLLPADPTDFELQRVALGAAEQAGNWVWAAQLAQALSAGVETAGAQRALARRAALHWQRAGDVARYEAALVALASADGDDVANWAAGELQRLTFQRGEWEASVSWGERTGESPGDEGRMLQAEALERLGRGDAAVPILEAVAANKGPRAGAALARIGAVHDRAGRWEQARIAYQAALEAGIPDAAAEFLKERVEALQPVQDPAGSDVSQPTPDEPPGEK